MAARKSSRPSPAQLREAFKTDLATCWEFARSSHPKETPYAFALHGLEGTPHLYPYVLTEEGLTQVAKRYVAEGYHVTVEEARRELRYSMEDSPYSTELEDKLPTVDAVMEPIEDSLDETEGYALLANAAMAAFSSLDKQGIFGKAKQRDSLVLMIETSLAEHDWSLQSVRRLNPRTVTKKYEDQTKRGVYASSDTLAVSADGCSLYFAGDRAVKSGRDPSISEIVACDVIGLHLKRRWEISSRSKFGRSVRDISCCSDGALFVLEAQYSRDKCTTVLSKIPRGTKSRCKEVSLPGEPLSCAVSQNGARVFVSLQDQTSCLLDQNLNTIQTGRLENLCSTQFLKNGNLLGITKRGIVEVDADFGIHPTAYRKDAFMISIDQVEKLCAVSNWSKDGLICDQKPRDQFGFKLLNFPGMKLIREIKIAGHQLVTATLSSGGELVACRASECGKYQSFVVIFETKSGREIARTKSDGFPRLAFLPGRDVLAMTTTTEKMPEPIILWKFR